MNYLHYLVRHRTTYHYGGIISVSHHLLCLRPLDLPNQRCLHHEIKITPTPALGPTRIDYFGNTNQFVTIEGAHDCLKVESISEVAIGPSFIPESNETPPWQVARAAILADQTRSGLIAREFAYDSPRVPLLAQFHDYALPSFGLDRPLLEAVADLTARLFSDFTFDPRATDVSTPIEQVFEERKGVCQDFAHLQMACLRSLGIPARYVSGYLETDPPTGQEKMIGSDASHAWLAFFCPGIGWIDVDPTNNCFPGMRHIKIACGRDYGDVSPLRGVIIGNGAHTLTVGVDVIPQGPITLPPDHGEADQISKR